MTRPTDHSLPGIGCELRITVSSGPTLKFRASPRESRDSTARGSPWLPVQTTHTSPGAKRLMFSTSMMSARIHAEQMELARQFDVRLHRAAHEGDLAARFVGDVGDLLDAVDVAREARDDHAALGPFEEESTQRYAHTRF